MKDIERRLQELERRQSGPVVFTICWDGEAPDDATEPVIRLTWGDEEGEQ